MSEAHRVVVDNFLRPTPQQAQHYSSLYCRGLEALPTSFTGADLKGVYGRSV